MAESRASESRPTESRPTQPTTEMLLARLTRVEQQLAHYEAGRMGRVVPRRQRRAHWKVGAALALLLALVPLSILGASPTFTDLGTAGQEHRADIQAIANAGITLGFDDPTSSDPNARLYDPKGTVTREQMASFLARTAGLGTNTPVVNAATARTLATNPTGTTTFAANELTRIAAFNADPKNSDYFLTTPPTRDIQTLTVSVPVQSYVLFQFSGYMIAQQGTGCPCQLEANARMDSDTSFILMQANLGTADTDYFGTFDRRAASGSYVFLASAGTHTFTLAINRLAGGSSRIGLASPAIQAIVFPFDGSGAGASAVPTGSSGQGSASSR